MVLIYFWVHIKHARHLTSGREFYAFYANPSLLGYVQVSFPAEQLAKYRLPDSSDAFIFDSDFQDRINREMNNSPYWGDIVISLNPVESS